MPRFQSCLKLPIIMAVVLFVFEAAPTGPRCDPIRREAPQAAGRATGRGITRAAARERAEARGYPVRGPWTEAFGRNPEAPECAVGRSFSRTQWAAAKKHPAPSATQP